MASAVSRLRESSSIVVGCAAGFPMEPVKLRRHTHTSDAKEGTAMTSHRFQGLVLLALACVMALPVTAVAQSAFSGSVKDPSGAVLPGVTVEAASPALIERVRTVVTDAQGRYTIVDLRPGVYT